MILWLLAGSALATDAFDPATYEAIFIGEETWDEAQQYQLWSAIERHTDPDALFVQEQFNAMTEWGGGNSFSPWIDVCFDSARPHSGTFLLHVGLTESASSGTPVLMVPGAGDNASRGFVTLAAKMDALGRPVYAITFAHPHGEILQQAEIVADAIARVRERTGAEQIDLVAHSKGGIAAAVYLANAPGADWGAAGADYAERGTAYRGDVRRAVFVATPLGGVDTSFRWPLGNLTALDADAAFSPTSWGSYYPYTTLNQLVVEDLSAQDFLPEGGDLFPGQRQVLARQSPDLPGEMPWLGLYALQPDWYTTYEGGWGTYSWSDGIDAAIAAGGSLLDRLAAQGADPDVELFVLAGENPLMPNSGDDLMVSLFGEIWSAVIEDTTGQWESLIQEVVAQTLGDYAPTDEEVDGLVSGDLILGEITAPSDGLVFVESATRAQALTARGAQVVETKVVDLSHLDLLYASPVTGELLIEAGEADPDQEWMIAFGERYTEADSLGWIVEVLADEDVRDTGDTGVDDSGLDSGGGDSGLDTGIDGGAHDTGEETGTGAPAGCCATNPRGSRGLGWLVVALVAAGGMRRRSGG